jgi:hypothetical protein
MRDANPEVLARVKDEKGFSDFQEGFQIHQLDRNGASPLRPRRSVANFLLAALSVVRDGMPNSESLLENFLSKRRQRQLNCQFRGAIMLINHRIHLDDFETQHAAVIGNDFHC